MEGTMFSVLIADDEATIRNGLREIIPWDMYHAAVIDTAADGVSALASIRRNRPDLAVMDIKMPGMDGLEVIRQATEEGILTRFLILSGYDDFTLAQRAIRYGAKAYFLKPLKLQDFQDELSRQFAELMAHRNLDKNPESIRTLLRTSRLFLLNQLVANELHSQEDLNRRVSMLGLRLHPDKPCCCVVLTPLTDDPEARSEALASADDVLSECFHGIACEIWQRADQAVIMLMNTDGVDTKALPQMLAKVTQKLSEKSNIRISAGIGPSVASALRAAESYSAAVRASNYALYCLPSDVYTYEMICAQKPPYEDQDPATRNALLAAIETNAQQTIVELCHTYIQSLFFVPYPPPDYVRGKCTALAVGICDRMNTLHAGEGPFIPPVADAVRHMYSIPELQDWLAALLTAYCVQYCQSKRQADPLIEAAKAYILEHLSENIKASDVASRINLSVSYFTTYFKTKAGCNFRDYVLEQKMKYAKELLQNQTMTISEIAYATGYTDYRSFSRAFKNITGHPPSDYQH